jgi:hypothetical protein
MRLALRAVAAFITCFGIGAALHFFIGRETRTWIVPALVTSAIVGALAYWAGR